MITVEQIHASKEIVVETGGVENIISEVDGTYTTYVWNGNSVTVFERDATKDSDEN